MRYGQRDYYQINSSKVKKAKRAKNLVCLSRDVKSSRRDKRLKNTGKEDDCENTKVSGKFFFIMNRETKQ